MNPRPRWGLAVVRGRSMEPTLSDGDRLLVRYAVAPRVGQVAVVRFDDGVLAVKRLALHNADGWWVSRDNPAEGRDSWSAGPIADPSLLGVAAARLWPRPRLLPASAVRR